MDSHKLKSPKSGSRYHWNSSLSLLSYLESITKPSWVCLWNAPGNIPTSQHNYCCVGSKSFLSVPDNPFFLSWTISIIHCHSSFLLVSPNSFSPEALTWSSFLKYRFKHLITMLNILCWISSAFITRPRSKFHRIIALASSSHPLSLLMPCAPVSSAILL